jgi:hypothetical protein
MDHGTSSMDIPRDIIERAMELREAARALHEAERDLRSGGIEFISEQRRVELAEHYCQARRDHQAALERFESISIEA